MEKFDQSPLKNIYKESVGTEPSDKELEKVERSLKVVFIRPCEALCPHCFIKRLTYMICLKRLREDFKLSSTDDVALAILDERGYRFLAELDKTRDIVKKRLEENSFLARILIATSGKLDGGSGAAGEERFLGRDILEACKNDLDRCRKIFNDLAREVVKSIANEKEDIRRKYVRELSKELFKEYMNSGIINDHSDIIDLYRLDRIPYYIRSPNLLRYS